MCELLVLTSHSHHIRDDDSQDRNQYDQLCSRTPVCYIFCDSPEMGRIENLAKEAKELGQAAVNVSLT